MFQLIFHSQFEEGTTFGIIALDDIEILYSQCPEGSSTVSIPMESLPVNLPENATSVSSTEDPVTTQSSSSEKDTTESATEV